MTAVPPDAMDRDVTPAAAARGWEPLLCYLIVQSAFVPFQLWRLQQGDDLAWLLTDLLGQGATIALLLLFPSGRAALRQRGALRLPMADVIRWIVGIAALSLFLNFLLIPVFAWIPDLALGTYPAPSSWLLAVALLVNLPVAVWMEELVYRRFAATVLPRYVTGTARWILVSALLFGAIHWWSGPLNVILAVVTGILLMLLYRRTGALWPAMASHGLINLFWFGLA